MNKGGGVWWSQRPGSRSHAGARAGGALLAGVGALLVSCGPSEMCVAETPLVRSEAWTLVGELDDPWSGDPGDRVPCTGGDVSIEAIGADDSWSVDTGICNWATAEQPLSADVEEGALLDLRLWYFSQSTFRGTVARLSVALGNDIAETWEVPIPVDSGVLHEAFVAPRSARQGTPIRFHLGNHGDNTWNLISIVRVDEVPCEGADSAP